MCACASLNLSSSSPGFCSIEKEMDFVDWRAELGPNFRQEVLIKVVDKLQSLVPSSDVPNVRNELNRLAIKFEKNIYEKAKSKSEYLAKIYQRLTRTKNSFHTPNDLTTSSSAGGLPEQVVLPDVLLFDTHPGSQLPTHLLQHSQNQQTTLGLPPLNGSSLQPNHHGSSNFSPIQKNNGLPAEPSKFQLPLNPELAISLQQQHRHIRGHSRLDQNISEPSKQYEQQNVSFRWQPEQSLLSQHNMDTIKYPLGTTSYGGEFLSSQQELGGFRSNLFSVQHVSSSLHEEQMTNKSSQSTQLHQSCNKKTSINEVGLHGCQNSSALNFQRLSDRNNPLLQAPPSDWQDLISQLQSMRSIYLPQLTSLYNRARAICGMESNVDQQEKYKHARLVLEKMIKFLHISDNDIMCFPKQKVVHYQKLIVQYVDSFHGKNPLSSSNIGRPDPIPCGSPCIPQKQNLRLRQSSLHARIEPSGESILDSPSRSFNSQHYTSRNSFDSKTAQLHLPHGPVSTKHQNSVSSPVNPNQKTNVAQSSSMGLELLKGMIQPRMLEVLPQKSDKVSHSVLRQVDNAASETIQQYCSTGQCSQKPNQSVASTILHQSHDDSTHKSMRSSLIVDQTEPPISKVGMQLPASPLLADSDSSLLHIGTDNLSEVSLPPSCTDNNVGPEITAGSCKVQHQTDVQDIDTANDIIGLPASPLLFDGPACKFALSVERLVKAVTEASHDVLITSIHDMFTIIDITEGIPNASGVADWPESVFSSHGERSARKMRRHLDVNAVETFLIDESDGSTRFCHSTAIYRTKRPRIERKQELLSEIRKINDQMVETVIEVVYDASEGAEGNVACEGTAVRITYNPVALSGNFKRLVVSSMMFPSVAVKLLIPSNYPDYSPEILDDLPVSSKGNEDFTEKAKCRFKRLLRSLPEPMSLGEMARVWDDCARELFSEFAYVTLGEVPEVYAWESIVTA